MLHNFLAEWIDFVCWWSASGKLCACSLHIRLVSKHVMSFFILASHFKLSCNLIIIIQFLFQKSFVFIHQSKVLGHFTVSSCPRLVLPAKAVSTKAELCIMTIRDRGHVEVHPKALVLCSLRDLNMLSCELVTFQSQSHITNNPEVDRHQHLFWTVHQQHHLQWFKFQGIEQRAFSNTATISRLSLGDIYIWVKSQKSKFQV